MGKISASENQPLNDHGLIMVDHHGSPWLEVEIYRTTKFILSLILSIRFIYVHSIFLYVYIPTNKQFWWVHFMLSVGNSPLPDRSPSRRCHQRL